ncbi:MAG TPA: hypothetical protein VML94_08485 [Thermoplasmata archaeon]|nr:hypothetical protein [Thermoplasmata archaeon]
MAAPSVPDLLAQITQLRQELAELRRRVAALERLVGTGSEHPTDRSVVQGKVSYDWQS